MAGSLLRMPRSLLARLSFFVAGLALVLTALVLTGILTLDASYSTDSASASPPPPPAAPVRDVRSTDAAIAAAEVAGRDLVGCVLARGFGACHTSAGIHDPRRAGAPLSARSYDDYTSSWAARVVIVRAGGGLAALAFDAEGLGVGYVIDSERVVNTMCVTTRGDCTKDPAAAAFLKDEARLAGVARRPSAMVG